MASIWAKGEKMFKLGLTGGIACGKSTVAQMLSQKGALVIDADQVAREVVLPGEPAWTEIVEWLGEEILLENGCLDRLKIGKRVFEDESARRKLNALIHPRVRDLFLTQSRELAQSHPHKIQVWDVPLLYEAGMVDLVDYVVVVSSLKEQQVRRLLERNGLAREESLQRINAQMDLQKKIEAADFVLANDNTRRFLQAQVDQFWEKLQRIKRHRRKHMT